MKESDTCMYATVIYASNSYNRFKTGINTAPPRSDTQRSAVVVSV